jgi:single-strand DNA-binding protein
LSSLNKVQLIGNIGKDVELKYTKGGASYCQLSLATTETWTNKKGERQTETEWHRVIVWLKQAENIARYCGKGSKIYVEGKLKTRSWDDGGQKRYSTEIQAERVKFLSGTRSEESPPKAGRSGTAPYVNGPENLGDHELDPGTLF